MQAWPELKYMPVNEPLIAAGRSASKRITLADLPPSSRVTRLSARPALAPISRPTAVEPFGAPAAGHELGPLFLVLLDVAGHTLELLGGDERAKEGQGVQAGAHFG